MKMNKIPTKKFLVMWDEILRLEHKTDSGLAEMIGIRASTVSNWRTGRTNGVRPHQITSIEKKLGYYIDLGKDGNWKIEKRGPTHPTAPKQDTSPVYFSMPGHITDAERERYEKVLRKLKEVPPGDIDRVAELIDLVFKKK